MSEASQGGAIRWMARNSIAANLLMAAFICGGLLFGSKLKREVFPELELDVIGITVAYPGASPAEVEQGVVKVVEEAVRGLEGIRWVRSTAMESVGAIRVKLLLGTDKNRALADVKSAVDRIRSFPLDAERPVVALATTIRQVITLVIYGDVEEQTLKTYAEQTRDGLLAEKGITMVEVGDVRPPEIAVEVSQESLRSHGLTLSEIARKIRGASLELPGGAIKTEQGEVLLRTAERRDYAHEFGQVAVLNGPDGSRVRLADIATVKETFQETDRSARLNGLPAATLTVYRVGNQSPTDIADTVRAYMDQVKPGLPTGLSMTWWNDQSQTFRSRMGLLQRNAMLGLALVLLILGAFLEIKLAFWVALGIVISFVGALLFIPTGDISINIISLFGFIVTLGIVVDDAIVVGESVFEKRRQGLPIMEAAIQGAREVGGPVTFSVLTTIAAFLPLLFVPGIMGQIMRNIPVVVISVLAVSLIESLYVLPAHLGHSKPPAEGSLLAPLHRRQQRISQGVQNFIDKIYQPALRFSLNNKALVLSISVALLLTTVGVMKGGHIGFSFLPKIDMDTVTVQARLPFGAPIAETRRVEAKLVAAAKAVIAEAGGPEVSGRALLSRVGGSVRRGGGPRGNRGGGGGSHQAGVAVRLVHPDQRTISAREFAKRWREQTGELVGLEFIAFRFSRSHGGGSSIEVQLDHPEVSVLEEAASQLAATLRGYKGVVEIDTGFSPGKPQLDIKLLPEAHSLGLSEQAVARQVRSAFYGAEALRQQRGRDELRVMVRLPEAQRRREHTFEGLLIRSPSGGEVPLARVATVRRSHADEAIQREDGRRVVRVTADVIPGVANAREVLESLRKAKDPQQPAVMASLKSRYPGLRWSFEGQSRGRRDSLSALARNFMLALLLIYSLLAIPFRSYIQPLIVMSSIPFGMVGAVAGHLLFGFELSLISMFGIVALSGIVVNDALVMIVAINRYRADGADALEAVVRGAKRRFRPIILTTLTTFFGLMPMVFETDTSARFLIPMAISLAFGVLFATFIILFQIPVLYMVTHRLQQLVATEEADQGLPEPSS